MSGAQYLEIWGDSSHAILASPARLATAVGTLVFDGPGKGRQSLGEATPEPRQGLERILALLMSRVLALLYNSRLSQIIGHSPLGSGVSRFLWFPEIHTRARYFKALARIEDPLYVLGTGHVHDPEAERMATLIPQNLREHHRSKRGEGLTERVISAKVGQPADMNMGTHVDPSW